MTTNELLYADLFLIDDEICHIDTAIMHLTGFTNEELRERDKHMEKAMARMVGMFFYIKGGNTLYFSGSRYGRDHATAFYAKRKIECLYGQKCERILTNLVNKMSEKTGIKL